MLSIYHVNFILILYISQDTNVTQYELMEALALNRCVTVVGDPDQSSVLFIHNMSV